MDQQGGVEFGFLLVIEEYLFSEQALEGYSFDFIEAQYPLEEKLEGSASDEAIDELIHLLLRVVLYLHWLLSKESDPNLAEVPYQLVLGI
jgi:hypothetical protein